MKLFAILFLMSSASASYAVTYDLSSNEAEIVKNASIQSIIKTDVNRELKQFVKLPKLENTTSIITADLLNFGDLKVTKKICVHADGTEIKTEALSYDVNIGIHLTFI